jgi:hypothetical protein
MLNFSFIDIWFKNKPKVNYYISRPSLKIEVYGIVCKEDNSYKIVRRVFCKFYTFDPYSRISACNSIYRNSNRCEPLCIESFVFFTVMFSFRKINWLRNLTCFSSGRWFHFHQVVYFWIIGFDYLSTSVLLNIMSLLITKCYIFWIWWIFLIKVSVIADFLSFIN